MKKRLNISSFIFTLILLSSTLTEASEIRKSIFFDTPLKVNSLNSFFAFLSNPFVSTILLTVATLLIIFELFFNLKGLGVGFSIISLVLFFIGNIGMGYTNSYELILFLIGSILLVFEVFIPGFGIPGILGIGFIIYALYNAMENPTISLISITVSGVIGLLVFVIILKMGFRSNAFNKIILEDDISSYASNDKNKLLGKTGITLSMLRPSGKISIDGDTYDAITEGNFIQPNKPIKVYRIEGFKIIVKEENI